MAQTMQWQGRTVNVPNWTAAIVAGLAAGAILMVLDLLWSSATSARGPWETSRMISAAVLGPQMLESSDYDLAAVVVALIAHYTSGVVFAIVVAAVMAQFRLDRSPSLAFVTGAVLGLILYLFNFYLLVYIWPWFIEIRGWATAFGHLVFGASAALLYWYFNSRSDVAPEA